MKRDLAAAAEASKGAAKQAIASLVPEDINGTKVYHGIFPGADRKTVTEGADRFAAEGGVCAFVSTGDSVSVILASGSSKVDCKVILGECLAKYGGRGGGKPALAQGGIPNPEDAEKLMQDMLSAVRSRL
jgi:alanyl-tRNA synthetase